MTVDLDAIRARCDRVEPGPWTADAVGDRDWETATQPGRHIPDVVRWKGYTNALDCGTDADLAEFIACAREDIPALCDEVERLRATVADLEERWSVVDGPVVPWPCPTAVAAGCEAGQ